MNTEVILVVSGEATAQAADGRVVHLRPGELFDILADPHDSRVVSNQPYISLHLIRADEYSR